mgnify:FL=1
MANEMIVIQIKSNLALLFAPQLMLAINWMRIHKNARQYLLK